MTPAAIKRAAELLTKLEEVKHMQRNLFDAGKHVVIGLYKHDPLLLDQALAKQVLELVKKAYQSELKFLGVSEE